MADGGGLAKILSDKLDKIEQQNVNGKLQPHLNSGNTGTAFIIHPNDSKLTVGSTTINSTSFPSRQFAVVNISPAASRPPSFQQNGPRLECAAGNGTAVGIADIRPVSRPQFRLVSSGLQEDRKSQINNRLHSIPSTSNSRVASNCLATEEKFDASAVVLSSDALNSVVSEHTNSPNSVTVNRVPAVGNSALSSVRRAGIQDQGVKRPLTPVLIEGRESKISRLSPSPAILNRPPSAPLANKPAVGQSPSSANTMPSSAVLTSGQRLSQQTKLSPGVQTALPAGQLIRTDSGQLFLVQTTGGQQRTLTSVAQRVVNGPAAAGSVDQELPAKSLVSVKRETDSPAAISPANRPAISEATPNSGKLNDRQAAGGADVEKCANFFKTLLRLSLKQQGVEMSNVHNLVQNVIYGNMSATVFTQEIQKALKSSAQPHLLSFLERTLPSLRTALSSGQITIPDIKPPPPPTTTAATSKPLQATTVAQAVTQPFGARLPTVLQSNSGLSDAGPRFTIAGPPSEPVRFCIAPSSVGQQHPTVMQQINSGGGVQQQAVHFAAPSQTVVLSTVATQPINTTSTFRPATMPESPRSLSTSSPAASAPKPTSKHSASKAVGRTQVATPATPEKFKDQEDDLNDVAAMGGVNLAEESQRIMASSGELLQMETKRKAQDPLEEIKLLNLAVLTRKIKSGLNRTELVTEFQPETAALISVAVEQKLRNLLERLNVLAEHRLDPLRVNPLYQQISNTRGQLRFLEEVDKMEQERREEREKEMLIKLSKSRSNRLESEDTERLKQKAKELQKAEQEEMRNKDANAAAAIALGGAFKRRGWAGGGNPESQSNDGPPGVSNPLNHSLYPSTGGFGGLRTQTARPKVKRVNIRDLQFVLTQERDGRQSRLLYQSFLGFQKPPG